MSVLLARGIDFESVQAQAPNGVDGQGKPAYDPAVVIQARVVREEQVARRPDGSEITTNATLWVDAAQPVLPVEEWQLTLPDGFVGVVVERMEGRGLGGVLDHIRLRLRRA